MTGYLKIKEFSKLANVSIRTLQYYDDIGILKPTMVDSSGHRFYDQTAFERIFTISTLKSIGFTLKDIDTFFRDPNFDLKQFIQNEKADTLLEIAKLQSKYMALNTVDFHEGVPLIQPISAHLKQDNSSQLNNEENEWFYGWNDFLKQLNSLSETNLTQTKTTKEIANYWQKNVLKTANDYAVNITNIENYYSKTGNQTNTFGMTTENYRTLQKILELHQKQ